MKYGLWDEILLKVEDDFGYLDKTYRSVKVMVIGYDISTNGADADYLCYVPQYEHIQDSFKINDRDIKQYNLEKKFLGDQAIFITRDTQIYKHIRAVQGEKCDRCSVFVELAMRDENYEYKCKACKLNPWR